MKRIPAQLSEHQMMRSSRPIFEKVSVKWNVFTSQWERRRGRARYKFAAQ